MIKVLVSVGVVVLSTEGALAQDYCDQVRQAVATYGYEAARKHALANYGKDAVATADKCLKAQDRVIRPHSADGSLPRRG